MSHSKEVFIPRNGKNVKIFTCGPSVYRRPHIGNYRTFLFEDLLVRYLEYKGYAVQRIINFTDIEDKTIEEAQEQGLSPERLTDAVKETFYRETKLLNIKLPDFIPSSATSVDAAAELISMLMEKGYAYRYRNNIFFDPLKKKDFGKLAGLDMSKWPKKKVRFKKDTYPGARWNRGDFILWHGTENISGPVWDTKIGKGRPSWNIQDPAMIYQHLGFEIDIKCGGIDNIVRHHDYNIAVIEALSGSEFASYYMHGEHLFVDGKKMSKSAGNIYYPDALIKNSNDANALRYLLTGTHYRKKLNFTEKKYRRSREQLQAVQCLIDGIAGKIPSGGHNAAEADYELIALFEKHMDNDLHAGLFVDDLVSELGKAYAGGMIRSEKAFAVLTALRKINGVLNIFTLP